jgi:hypothetical protein
MFVAYGIETLVVALIVGAVSLLVGLRRPFTVLAALLLLLPFHEWSRRWMLASLQLSAELVNAISRWWMVMALALLLAVGLRWLFKLPGGRPLPRPRWHDALLALVIGVGMVSVLLSPNRSAGFAAFRNYFQPVVLFVLARLIVPTEIQWRRFLWAWLAVGLVMAAFALWQFGAWTEADYYAQGYVRPNGELVTPPVYFSDGSFRLRPSSTVSGPNELGVHMVLLFIASLQWMVVSKGRARWLLGLLSVAYLIALAISYSRSALLAWIMAVVMLGLMALTAGRAKLQQEIRQRKGLVIAGAVAVLVLVGVIFVSTGMAARMIQTVRNLSSEYHFEDTVGAIEFLVRQPAGVGMGLVGPREGIFFPAQEAFHVEGSLFQIGMEMGVWGLGLWLAYLAAVLWATWRARQRTEHPLLRLTGGTAIAGWLGALVAFLFLPLMQAMVLMSWLWFLLGTGLESERIERTWREGRTSSAAASQVAASTEASPA